MKITNPENLCAGHWVSHCCYLDMHQVKKTDVSELRSLWDESIQHNDPAPDVWETEVEALEDMLAWGFNERDKAEIRARLTAAKESK